MPGNRKQRSPRRQRSARKNRQSGGRVTMPSEYFGGNSGRYFAAGSAELNIGPSAYGVNHPTSRGTCIGQNLNGPDLGPTRHSGIQTGGFVRGGIPNTVTHQQGCGRPFQFITNPETNRKVSINSRIGKRVLKNYLQRSAN